MSRGDLDKAGAKVGIDVPILKDGNLAVDDGKLDGLTHEAAFSGSFGETATPVSPSMVSGRVVATTM